MPRFETERIRLERGPLPSRIDPVTRFPAMAGYVVAPEVANRDEFFEVNPISFTGIQAGNQPAILTVNGSQRVVVANLGPGKVRRGEYTLNWHPQHRWATQIDCVGKLTVRVTNGATGDPLPYVSANLYCGGKRISVGGTFPYHWTDANGLITMDVPRVCDTGYELHVARFCYETQIINLGTCAAGDVVDVALMPAAVGGGVPLYYVQSISIPFTVKRYGPSYVSSFVDGSGNTVLGYQWFLGDDRFCPAYSPGAWAIICGDPIFVAGMPYVKIIVGLEGDGWIGGTLIPGYQSDAFSLGANSGNLCLDDSPVYYGVGE